MRAVLLIPWRGGEPSRERIWDNIRPAYEAMPWSVYWADSNPLKEFSRSEARNNAADEAGDWDVAAFIDADTLIPEDALAKAFEYADSEDIPVVPYDLTTFVSEDECSRDTVPGCFTGCIVISRSLWDRYGPYDERYTSWGYEDLSLYLALITFTRRVVKVPDAVAMKYEHRFTPGELGNLNSDLWSEYHAAANDPEAMLGLVQAAKRARRQ